MYCRDCFRLEKECSLCLDNSESFINVCSILYEGQIREIFHQATFFSFHATEITNDALKFKYLPESSRILPSSKPTYFQTIPKNRLKPEIFIKEKASAFEKLFKFLLEEKIFNVTFISHDDQMGRILEEISKTLLENGVIPNVVGTTQLWLVELPQVGLRFVSSLNYFTESVIELSKKYSKRLLFFPQKLNKKAFFNYNGRPPSTDNFFGAQDSKSIIAAKDTFIKQISKQTNWNFKNEIKLYVEFRLGVIALANLNFIMEAYDCQKLLYGQLSSDSSDSRSKFCFLMPFNPPFFTRASYAFHLLLSFAKPIGLKVPRPPIAMKSSRQEIEFCAFLRWKFPNLTFIDAWSPNGQMTFKESYPDSVCLETKVAFYFNGCPIHGHKLDECKLKRKKSTSKNYFGVSFNEALEAHERKTKLLRQNHPTQISTVETVWECIWRQKKRMTKRSRIF